jgi:hypothetical protein
MGPDQLIAIQDSSAGIFVRLTTVPAGLQVGRSIEVAGVLASPYGQLEVRQLSELEIGSLGPDPAPTAFGMGDIGEEGEGTLATVHGTVDSVLVDSGRLSMSIGDGGSVLRVFADPHTGLTIGAVKRGSRVVATGIVGQRATAQGRQDGYRLWLRGRADLVVDSGSIAGPSQNPTPLPTASGSAIHHDLASALGSRGSIVDVTATVTASVGLIDWGGPTIVVTTALPLAPLWFRWERGHSASGRESTSWASRAATRAAQGSSPRSLPPWARSKRSMSVSSAGRSQRGRNGSSCRPAAASTASLGSASGGAPICSSPADPSQSLASLRPGSRPRVFCRAAWPLS